MSFIVKTSLIFLWFSFLIGCATTKSSQVNPEAAKYNTQLGFSYLQQGDVSRAKSKFLLAIQEAPEDPLVLDGMGYFLEATSQTAAAEKYYLSALFYAPHDGAAQNNYGGFLCRHQRNQEAIQHFLLAAEEINYLNTATAYENAGICALKIPDKNLARQYLQQAISVDPNLTSAKIALMKLNKH